MSKTNTAAQKFDTGHLRLIVDESSVASQEAGNTQYKEATELVIRVIYNTIDGEGRQLIRLNKNNGHFHDESAAFAVSDTMSGQIKMTFIVNYSKLCIFYYNILDNSFICLREKSK